MALENSEKRTLIDYDLAAIRFVVVGEFVLAEILSSP
jgi:hypothetical protein